MQIDIDRAKLDAKRTQSKRAAQMMLDQDVLKDSNNYIPKQIGTLEGSGIRSSLIGQGLIIWDTPYARRLYYNPQYNFSTDKNPYARGLWFEEAKAVRKGFWLDKVRQNYEQYFNGK
jgi:hypothetical protein